MLPHTLIESICHFPSAFRPVTSHEDFINESKKHLMSPLSLKPDSVYADALLNLVRHFKHPEDHDNTPTHHSHSSEQECHNIIRIEIGKSDEQAVKPSEE